MQNNLINKVDDVSLVLKKALISALMYIITYIYSKADKNMEDLIKELRVARNKKGLTQSALAHRVGLPQGHISSIEQGKIDLRVSTLIQMARILEYEVMLVPSQFTSLVKAMIEGKEGIESEPIWQPDEEED